MLKHRIITAVILVAILLTTLFAPNPLYWQVAISIAIMAAFYEWLRFCEIDVFHQKLFGYVVFIGFAVALKLSVLSASFIVPAVCLLWLVLLSFTFYDVPTIINDRWVKLAVGIVILATAGWLIIELKRIENGTLWVVGFFLAVVAADVGAYFSGKRFGKRKLAPKISPGKTVEGFIGGLILVVVVFTPILFSQFQLLTALGLLLTVLVTAIVSVGGDLFESKLKRHVGLKDSSQILPGHGGVLDRVDSLMAGVPFFVLGLILLDIVA